MLNLAEYRRRPALLADWLPWAGLVAPGVVLNKDGSFQRTALFSSGLQRMGAWSSASSRYVAFRCRCAQTNFPRFTCGATCKISSEKMSRETGTARIPDSSFASRSATASRSSSPSACPPSQAQDW